MHERHLGEAVRRELGSSYQLGGRRSTGCRTRGEVGYQDRHPLKSHRGGDADVCAAAFGAAVGSRRKTCHSVLSAVDYAGWLQGRQVAEEQGRRLGVAGAMLPRVYVLSGGYANEISGVAVHLGVLDGYERSPGVVHAAKGVGVG